MKCQKESFVNQKNGGEYMIADAFALSGKSNHIFCFSNFF